MRSIEAAHCSGLATPKAEDCTFTGVVSAGWLVGWLGFNGTFSTNSPALKRDCVPAYEIPRQFPCTVPILFVVFRYFVAETLLSVVYR